VENLGVQYFIGSQEVADKLITNIVQIDWRWWHEREQDKNSKRYVRY
jgi:hypothetical protein